MNVYEVYIKTAIRYTVIASDEKHAQAVALNMPIESDVIDIQPELGEITRVKYLRGEK